MNPSPPSAPASAAAALLRYAGDRAFAPYESLDAQGRPQGFQIDLLAALGPRLGAVVDVQLRPWPETEAVFRAGQCDLVAMVPTADRSSWARFTRGHASPVLGVYRRQDLPEPQGPQALAGLRVAVLDGDAMRETLATLLGTLPPPAVVADTPLAALQTVARGQADAAVLLQAYADPLLMAGQKAGGPAGELAQVRASRLPLGAQSYGFAVLPGREALLQRLQQALDAMEADGSLDALRLRWLPSHRGLAEAHRLQAGVARSRQWTWAVAGSATLAVAGLAWALSRRQRQAQAERQQRLQAEAALQRAGDLLERSFTQHPQAMLVVERGTAVVRDANQAAHRLLGLSAGSLIGQPLARLQQHLPAVLLQTLAAALDMDGEIVGAPLQLHTSDGGVRDCLLSADEMAVGGSVQVFCLLHDVTDTLHRDAELRAGYDSLLADLRRTEGELDQARQRRAQAEERLEDFTQAVTHDLKAPLRALQGLTGLLRARVQAGHTREALAYTHHIERAGERMQQMVTALGRLAQVTRQPLQRQPVEMGALARGSWALLTMAHPEWTVRCDVDALPVAQGDPSLLGLVWQNLLENAARFSAARDDARDYAGTGAGTGTGTGAAVPAVRVRVDSHQDARGTWYRITDNGVGFDMSRAAGLFQPFVRLHPDPRWQGSGIGLAQVRRIVELHGGDMRLRSAPGVGTVAEFTLDPPRR